MENSPSETKSSSSSHENPYILKNTKVHYRVRNPSLAPILNKVDPVKALHLRLALPSGLFPLDCLNKTLYT
jgi:hypothetical protein